MHREEGGRTWELAVRSTFHQRAVAGFGSRDEGAFLYLLYLLCLVSEQHSGQRPGG